MTQTHKFDLDQTIRASLLLGALHQWICKEVSEVVKRDVVGVTVNHFCAQYDLGFLHTSKTFNGAETNKGSGHNLKVD